MCKLMDCYICISCPNKCIIIDLCDEMEESHKFAKKNNLHELVNKTECYNNLVKESGLTIFVGTVDGMDYCEDCYDKIFDSEK